MLGALTGTIIDTSLVILGALIGGIFKADIFEKISERVFQVFIIFILVIGISGALDLSNMYLILASLIVGVIFGEVIDLDKRINKFGDFVQRKLVKTEEHNFIGPIIETSLLVCIGSLTIMGALQSGIDGQHTMLVSKGILDCVTAATISLKHGKSVGFAAIPLFLYEGTLTLLAKSISPLLTDDVMQVIGTVGSLILIAMALNLLDLTKLKVVNFLPAIFIPLLYQGGVMLFHYIVAQV